MQKPTSWWLLNMLVMCFGLIHREGLAPDSQTRMKLGLKQRFSTNHNCSLAAQPDIKKEPLILKDHNGTWWKPTASHGSVQTGSEPTLYWLKQARPDDRQAGQSWQTGAHMLHAVCSVQTPKYVRHGSMGWYSDGGEERWELSRSEWNERRWEAEGKWVDTE